MKSTRIKTFIFIIYFFALFFNNISQIKAAEAPDDNSSDDLSQEHVTHITGENNPLYAMVSSLAGNYYERNILAELIIVELSIYVSLLLKLFALVNSVEIEERCLPLKQFFVSFLLNSTFERRNNMVSKEKFEILKQSLNSKYIDLRDKLSQQMHENSVKLFDTVIKNKNLIQENIDFLLNILLVLFDLGIERFLGSSAFALFSFFDEYELVLDDFSSIFSSSSRKEISCRFISNKDAIKWVDFDFCYNRVDLNSLEEKVDKSDRDQFTSQIINSSSLDIEELCKTKEILLTALDLLKTGLYIIFIFERNAFFAFLSHVREMELKIKEELDKINCDGLPEQKYLELKITVRDLLRTDEVQSNNLVGECFEDCLTKETITSSMTSVYKSLLSAILVLKSFGATFLGVDFFKLLFENILKLFEDYTKKCAQQIKKVKSLTEEEVQNLQMSTMKKKYKKKKELYRQSLMIRAEIEKKENRERKQREKKIKEEKERLERERLSEEIKNKEKKSRKKKTRSKREFPIVEASAADISKEDVEAQTSTSSYASQEVSSEAKQQACRPKLNRKQEKLNKLLKEEQKSLQREEVKKTILEQKYSNLSTKKRKQDERKTKNENRREREERERLEEREREMEKEKKKRERIEHTNYMYTLLNSISSIEGLFAEAEKSRAGISGLISLVFQIISEEKVETEEASTEEGISSMFASLSVSDTVTSQQQASGLSRTGMELGARPKTRVGGPKPRSSSSSSSSSRSRSSARRRSRSRSRSRRSSKSRVRSSRSRVRSSRSRGRSRSRDKSSEARALTFDGFEVPDSIFSSTLQEDPNKSSKFLQYFQTVNELDSQDSSVFEQKYLEYEQKLIDLTVVTQNSLEDEILSALELCGSLIQTLHEVVIPLVHGKELMYLKLLERTFVKFFIKFLIFLQQKKDE